MCLPCIKTVSSPKASHTVPISDLTLLWSYLTSVAQLCVMLRALQCRRPVRNATEAVRGGRAPPVRLQAWVWAVSVGLTWLGGGVAVGEMTSGTTFTHRVTHRCTWRRWSRVVCEFHGWKRAFERIHAIKTIEINISICERLPNPAFFFFKTFWSKVEDLTHISYFQCVNMTCSTHWMWLNRH